MRSTWTVAAATKVHACTRTLTHAHYRAIFFLMFSYLRSPTEVAVDKKKPKGRGKAEKGKKKGKKDAWNAAQKCKSLTEILDEAEYHKYPSWVPTYTSIAAAPSRYPPRKFCAVTGLAGKYQCPVTGESLATLDAYGTHRETRLKGLV